MKSEGFNLDDLSFIYDETILWFDELQLNDFLYENGNLVKIVSISQIGGYTIAVVDVLLGNIKFYSNNPDMKSICNNAISELKPIPITQEILFSFGFKTETVSFHDNSTVFENYRAMIGSDMLDVEFYNNKFSVNGHDIHYVHQLQNIMRDIGLKDYANLPFILKMNK